MIFWTIRTEKTGWSVTMQKISLILPVATLSAIRCRTNPKMISQIVSQKTLLAQIPFVENVDDELAAVKKESEENLKQQQEMFGLQKNDPPEEDNLDDSQQKAEEKKIDE